MERIETATVGGESRETERRCEQLAQGAGAESRRLFRWSQRNSAPKEAMRPRSRGSPNLRIQSGRVLLTIPIGEKLPSNAPFIWRRNCWFTLIDATKAIFCSYIGHLADRQR